MSSATAFGDHLRMVWLTPAMDGLFLGAASERRRFFDRLVLAIDSEHSSRVSALERSLRSRNRLLEVRNYDDHWCDAIERETAELAVAVAATRGQTVTKLAAMLRERGADSAFPSAQIMLDGWMENALVNEPATAVEDRYREILRAGRARDAAAGRTLDGPHLTDLQVVYAPKNMPARDASTGEQKALLIGLVLAHATLVAEMTGIVPLLLLDEVVAHLDPNRRKALFDELAKLGAQVWMTGADPAAFVDIGTSGEIFDVEFGQVSRDLSRRACACIWDRFEPNPAPARLAFGNGVTTSRPLRPRGHRCTQQIPEMKMPEIARGVIPAGKRLLPLIFLLVVGAPLAAKADNGIVDVRTLPRLEGAVEDSSRTQSYSMSYGVPTVVAVTSAATRKLLAADGWVQFLRAAR